MKQGNAGYLQQYKVYAKGGDGREGRGVEG